MTVDPTIRRSPGPKTAPGSCSHPLQWAGSALAVLLLLGTLACTSGGGPTSDASTAAPAAASSGANTLVEADGGHQTGASGALDHQAVIGENTAASTASSADGTYQNRPGLNPAATASGL